MYGCCGVLKVMDEAEGKSKKLEPFLFRASGATWYTRYFVNVVELSHLLQSQSFEIFIPTITILRCCTGFIEVIEVFIERGMEEAD